MTSISLQLVTWNGATYLQQLFASLRAQTRKDWDLAILDNASTDATREMIQRVREGMPQRISVVYGKTNLGFAGGHNQLFGDSAGAYVQLLNQDTVLHPHYVERLAGALDRDSTLAAVQGAICRWDVHRGGDGRTDVIDSLGLQVQRNRRVREIDGGEAFEEDDRTQEVFGVSGALPMYRRAAVESVARGGLLFDASFESYKEDVELAYRLRSRGWTAACVRGARAWHDRTASGPQTPSDRAAASARSHRGKRERYCSYRNHLATLIMNEHPKTFSRDWPSIVWYEAKKLAYVAGRDPQCLRAWGDLWMQRKDLCEKRRAAMRRYEVDPRTLAEWFQI
jgi:GT2 family glycosyltransferase